MGCFVSCRERFRVSGRIIAGGTGCTPSADTEDNNNYKVGEDCAGRWLGSDRISLIAAPHTWL